MQLIYFNSGSTAVTALITGDTPISQAAGPGVINATINGSDTVMIAGGNVTLDYWMLSRPEIKPAEQLKGGAVAISRFGSASDFIVRYALQRLGLTPVKDVAILQVGSLTERYCGDGDQASAGDRAGAAGDVSSADARLQYPSRHCCARSAVSGNRRRLNPNIHS